MILKGIDTTALQYVMLPENHIVIDFDNLKEASKWPKTYTELSKNGAGIRLHYIYDERTKKND